VLEAQRDSLENGYLLLNLDNFTNCHESLLGFLVWSLIVSPTVRAVKKKFRD
jgi:hypothetical protein